MYNGDLQKIVKLFVTLAIAFFVTTVLFIIIRDVGKFIVRTQHHVEVTSCLVWESETRTETTIYEPLVENTPIRKIAQQTDVSGKGIGYRSRFEMSIDSTDYFIYYSDQGGKIERHKILFDFAIYEDNNAEEVYISRIQPRTKTQIIYNNCNSEKKGQIKSERIELEGNYYYELHVPIDYDIFEELK